MVYSGPPSSLWSTPFHSQLQFTRVYFQQFNSVHRSDPWSTLVHFNPFWFTLVECCSEFTPQRTPVHGQLSSTVHCSVQSVVHLSIRSISAHASLQSVLNHGALQCGGTLQPIFKLCVPLQSMVQSTNFHGPLQFTIHSSLGTHQSTLVHFPWSVVHSSPQSNQQSTPVY